MSLRNGTILLSDQILSICFPRLESKAQSLRFTKKITFIIHSGAKKRIQENCSTSSDGNGTCFTVDINGTFARPSDILDIAG